MESKIRILGIAPYEGMTALMRSLAEEYPQIELTLFVGDMEQGLEIAKSNFHSNYDVVISRGGTARMLRSNLSLPVVEIEISMYDILCALKLADGLTGKTALVSFANITDSARMLCRLMNYDMDLYTVDSPEAIESTMRRLQDNHYQSILCDVVANTTAKRLGLNSFLITSGLDSIRRAFDQAVFLCSSQERLRSENQFFRQLLQGQIGETVVFDRSENLYLSTLSSMPPEVLNMLRRELHESQKVPERRIIRNLNGMLYSIRAQRITEGPLSFVAFFFNARKAPMAANQAGIRFSTRPEAEASFYNSIFSFAGTICARQDEIDRISHSSAPVVVTGEDGTGKESIVSILYLRSALQNNPLVTINCSLLNDKSWDFLLEHHNSPLSDQDTTIFFENIDALVPERQRQLMAVLSEMDVCRRNRVIFSCVCQPGEHTSEVGSLFMDKLCCLSLYLQPLRTIAERIPGLVNLSISHLNANLPRQIMGTEPEAMDLLQKFQWPHNYTQFRRIMGELAVTADGPVITANIVRPTLKKERHVGAFSLHVENSSAPLDLNRTLAEIDRDVAFRVVEETGGNQTAAAKRLGISRTTLWRLLQK